MHIADIFIIFNELLVDPDLINEQKLIVFQAR